MTNEQDARVALLSTSLPPCRRSRSVFSGSKLVYYRFIFRSNVIYIILCSCSLRLCIFLLTIGDTKQWLWILFFLSLYARHPLATMLRLVFFWFSAVWFLFRRLSNIALSGYPSHCVKHYCLFRLVLFSFVTKQTSILLLISDLWSNNSWLQSTNYSIFAAWCTYARAA